MSCVPAWRYRGNTHGCCLSLPIKKMKHKSGVNPINWSIISFARRNYCGCRAVIYLLCLFPRRPCWASCGGEWRMSSWLQQLAWSFFLVSPPITVGCGQQQHHFSWQHFNKSLFFLCRLFPLLSLCIFFRLRCQSTIGFYPLSLIKSLISPSPHLYYRPSLHVDVDVLPLADRDSPSGCVALHVASFLAIAV